MQHLIAGAHCSKKSAACLNSTFVDASRTVPKILVDGGLTASSILIISERVADHFKLLGVTWIDSLGISPFEIDVELDPNDNKYFAKTVFRIGTLDTYGRPSVCIEILRRRVCLSFGRGTIAIGRWRSN